MKPFYSLIAAGLLLTGASANAALLQIHENELLSSCQVLKVDPASSQAGACATYINGFLDGALLTDSANALEMQEVVQSNFVSRAIRTRLGEREGGSDYLHFCIPSQHAKADVIEQLAPYIPGANSGTNHLKASIYAGLKAEYPCQKKI